MNKNSLRKNLALLYSDTSKHSSYQSIPDFVASAIDYQVKIDEGWRGDRVRLNWLDSLLAEKTSCRWADLGANTGFFSLSIAHADPSCEVIAIEGNPNHANFIQTIAEAFDIKNLKVVSRAIGIDELEVLPRVDVMLHLNVLHHAGADFAVGKVQTVEDLLQYAHDYLQLLRDRVETLVFQMGTNMWGNKGLPIIDYTDDAGKLVLLSKLLRDAGWRIDRVAFAVRPIDDADIEYVDLPLDLDLSDLAAIDAVLAPFNLSAHRGEFYRRPIFLCNANVDWPNPMHGNRR